MTTGRINQVACKKRPPNQFAPIQRTAQAALNDFGQSCTASQSQKAKPGPQQCRPRPSPTVRLSVQVASRLPKLFSCNRWVRYWVWLLETPLQAKPNSLTAATHSPCTKARQRGLTNHAVTHVSGDCLRSTQRPHIQTHQY
jgi:hypothetical protein